MTEDTKKALEIIKPLADELRINLEANDHMLYMDGQGIGIACNSTYATLMEMVGYIFLKEYVNEFRGYHDDLGDVPDFVKRYWAKKGENEA